MIRLLENTHTHTHTHTRPLPIKDHHPVQRMLGRQLEYGMNHLIMDWGEEPAEVGRGEGSGKNL